jgi:hypothetical protein
MKRALCGLLLLALGGCAAKAHEVQVPRACTVDTDCPNNQVCLDVGCAAPDQHLVVQVVPPQDRADLATQDFADVDDSKGIVLDLGPPGTLHLTSTLYPFTLSFAGTPLHIPDLPYSLQPVTVTADSRLPVATGKYFIVATPQDSIIPPLQVTAHIDAPGANLDVPLQFQEPSALVHLQGALRASRLNSGNAAPSYTVQVLHADQTPASQPTSATPAFDGGYPGDGDLPFSLYLAPSGQGETLRLVAWPATGSIGPSVAFDGTLDALLALVAADGGLSLGSASPLPATGTVVDPAGAPVAGATVQLIASLPGQAHYTSPAVTTDAQGEFQTTCLHDRDSPSGESYQLLVVPPAASSLATTLATPTASWDGGGEAHDFGAVSLVHLTDTTGQVFDGQGNPVEHAMVQATPASTNTVPLHSASATTDSTGTYHLALSPGQYHFDYAPPLSLQAPSTGRGPLAIAGANQRLPDVTFSAARTASGAVFGPDGQGVDKALVRVYLVLPSSGGSGTDTPRSTLLATSLTLADGSFSVVLPAPSTPAP